jgi:hypothetical protein
MAVSKYIKICRYEINLIVINNSNKNYKLYDISSITLC